MSCWQARVPIHTPGVISRPIGGSVGTFFKTGRLPAQDRRISAGSTLGSTHCDGRVERPSRQVAQWRVLDRFLAVAVVLFTPPAPC